MRLHRPAAATASGSITLVCTILITTAAWADPPAADYFNPEDFSSEALFATGVIGVGARAVGMGGAYTAVSDDINALVYNPAGLAQLGRIETSLGLQHLSDESRHHMFGSDGTATATHTGLDHFGIAYPFPTYRGSLVIAGGAFRARTNDLASARFDRRPGYNDDFQRSQRDGVYRYTGGIGVDLLQSLSFGTSLTYWEGQLRDDQYRRIDEVAFPAFNGIDRLVTNADLDGFSFDLGLLGYLGRSGRLGLTVHSPVWLDIRGDGQLVHQDPNNGPTTTQLLYIDQQPRLPWSVSMGLSLALRRLLLSAEGTWTAWDEIDLDLPAGGPSDPPPGTRPDYESSWSARAGAELMLPFLPVRVRAGYAITPQPYTLLLGNPSRLNPDHQTVSAGAGLLLADAFALDAALTFGTFERFDDQFGDVAERREETRFYLTGAYRY